MKKLTKILLAALIGTSLAVPAVDACSRFTYSDDNGSVITARSMDWQDNIPGDICVFRRGVVRQNDAKGSSMPEWKVKYGSVGIFNLGSAVSSAMNEKGLVIDFLWLAESDYGEAKDGETTISLHQLGQYIVDTCASVDEVERNFKQIKLRPVITDDDVISGAKMTMHLMITDKSGNNGVIEWIGGDMHFHKKQGRMVMTNDPGYEKMLAIRDYYREMGVENSMPGSALSQARFVYIDGWLKQIVNEPLPGYIGGIKDQNLDEQKLYSALSVIRGVSTPLGVAFDTSHPNNTSTIWRTMSDLKNNKFYYDSALTPSFFWVDLNKLDFTKEASIHISDGKILNGDITELLAAQ